MLDRKLAFDPTPEFFSRTLRKRYKGFWKRIRDRRFKNGGFLCDICRSDRERRDRLDAHEMYAFPRPGVVKLEKIVFICKSCHDAIHLERTRREAGHKWIAEVEAHYCSVNGITAEELAQDFHKMMLQSKELRILYGTRKPRMDYGEYQAEADLCESRKQSNKEEDADFEQYPDHECPWDVGHAD
jgi:hypothetical protein